MPFGDRHHDRGSMPGLISRRLGQERPGKQGSELILVGICYQIQSDVLKTFALWCIVHVGVLRNTTFNLKEIGAHNELCEGHLGPTKQLTTTNGPVFKDDERHYSFTVLCSVRQDRHGKTTIAAAGARRHECSKKPNLDSGKAAKMTWVTH
ncbi:hypothetical protein ElyMa_004766100 [Elysia marginata]|uniref:Uncharacterized protein n=1 Tax=Elysia marginata TaxID=1093978 RepID=A0AAV4IG51_9GAST|nr:hypothetical protein ElyMa_004766100 [Elysia marginata]